MKRILLSFYLLVFSSTVWAFGNKAYVLLPKQFLEQENISQYESLFQGALREELEFDDIANYRSHLAESHTVIFLQPMAEVKNYGYEVSWANQIEALLRAEPQKKTTRFRLSFAMFYTMDPPKAKKKAYSMKDLVFVSFTDYCQENWHKLYRDVENWDKYIPNWGLNYFKVLMQVVKFEESFTKNKEDRNKGDNRIGYYVMIDSLKLATRMPVYVFPDVFDLQAGPKYPPTSESEKRKFFAMLPKGSCELVNSKFEELMSSENPSGTLVFKASDVSVYFIDIETGEIFFTYLELGRTPDMIRILNYIKKKTGLIWSN